MAVFVFPKPTSSRKKPTFRNLPSERIFTSESVYNIALDCFQSSVPCAMKDLWKTEKVDDLFDVGFCKINVAG
jgi:hypothetical protein